MFAYENIRTHRSAFLVRKELEPGLNKGGLIDDPFHRPIAKSAKKFRKILERITARFQNIAKKNLFILGQCESLVSNGNTGNFLAKC